MSKRSMVGAAIGLAAVVALPVAAEAHCLHYKHFRSEVVGVVDGTTTFVKRVTYRTRKFGDRMFGWLMCDKHL
jgi:hypothetical protein